MLYLDARNICILAVVFLWLNGSVCNNTPTVDDQLFRELLTALERVYHFYELEYKNINLDGIYGLRVSEGALVRILEEQKSGELNLDKETVSRISSLQRLAAFAAKKSLPILKKTYPSYFKKFEVAISGPWKKFKSFRKLDHSLFIAVDKRSEISFDEDTSDQCMTEMTGTGDRPSKPCELSAHCWNLMTSKGAGGYALTHQALFLLIGESQGCKNNILKRLKELNNGINLQGVYDRICASMYPQMLEYEKKKSSVNYERDLYIEQGMVCGSLGFNEFLSPKRLRTILGWQKKSGCYGDLDDEEAFPYHGDSRRDDTASLDQQNMKRNNFYDNEGNMNDKRREDGFRLSGTSRKLMSMRTMRSLLVEKALDGGCMSHLTGVATGTLGVYLRWAAHMKFPGPHSNHASSRDAPKKHPSEDLPNHDKKSDEHHIYMRRMMQKQPLLVSGKHDAKHARGVSMTTSAGVLMIAIVTLLVGYGSLTNKRLITKAWAKLRRKKTCHVI